MHLPSFIWLWKIAAWSMGLSLLAYLLLAVTGVWMFRMRTSAQPPVIASLTGVDGGVRWATPRWMRWCVCCRGLLEQASTVPLAQCNHPERMVGQQHPLLRSLHYTIGLSMVSLVLLLLAIGIIGTLGHFGSLGHSSHLVAGLIVVVMVLLSAVSATQISARRPWARALHIGTNIVLFIGFAWVSLTGWIVVQKYLP